MSSILCVIPEEIIESVVFLKKQIRCIPLIITNFTIYLGLKMPVCAAKLVSKSLLWSSSTFELLEN